MIACPTRRMLCDTGISVFIFVFVAFLFFTEALCQAPGHEPQTSAVKTSRLSTTVSVPSQGGTTQKVLIEIDDWRFGPGDTLMTMPADGAGVMSVGNGTISVRVGGASKTYYTGDYWPVPAGTQMTISIQRPTRGAIVRTVIAIPTT